MKFLVILIIPGISYFLYKNQPSSYDNQARPFEDIGNKISKSYYKQNKNLNINTYCSKSHNKIQKKNNKLHKLLNKAQNSFIRPQQRLSKPEKYIEYFDQILLQSGNGFLLKCRNDWISLPNRSYKVSFIDVSKDKGKNMQLKGDNNLELIVDLHTSFQKVLFTYAHELFHVCQKSKGDKLYFLGKLGGEDYYSYLFLKEIESFVLMLKVYEDLLPYSRRLCFEEYQRPKIKKDSLYKIYSAGKDSFFSGTLPQWVITWYSNRYSKYTFKIFKKNSKERVYSSSILGPEFKQKCFTSNFLESLEEGGIPVDQLHCK